MTQRDEGRVVGRLQDDRLGKLPGSNAVCEQGEWDEMERGRPGHHELIREGIANEPEAEQLARESPGGTIHPIHLKKRLLVRTRV